MFPTFQDLWTSHGVALAIHFPIDFGISFEGKRSLLTLTGTQGTVERYFGSFGQRVYATRRQEEIRRHPLVRREMCRILVCVAVCADDLRRSKLGRARAAVVRACAGLNNWGGRS